MFACSAWFRQALAGLFLSLALFAPQSAAAQEAPDWASVYKRSRTANYVSYVAPAVGIGGGAALVAKGANGSALDALIFIPLGVLTVGAGMVAGGPLQAWSGVRGARALSELGHPVTRVPGYVSWGGSALSATGVALLLLPAAFDPEEDTNLDDAVMGTGLMMMLIGFPITYGAGLVQWMVNRKAWQGGARPPVTLLNIGSRW